MIDRIDVHTKRATKRLYITAGEIQVGDLLVIAGGPPLVEVKTISRLDPWPNSSASHGWNKELGRWNGPIVHMGVRPVEPLPRAGEDGIDLIFIARFDHESVDVWR